MWTRLGNKLRHLLRGGGIEAELDRELEFHRALLVRDAEGLGLSRDAALLEARRRMGNTTLMTEQARDAWLITWFDTLVRDARFALRSFRRNPGFTFIAVLTLALGIGANTAIFQLLDAVLLRTLPAERPEELSAVRRTVSFWQFEQLRDRNSVFSGLLGTRILTNGTLMLETQPLQHQSVELVTGNYFSLLGVQPVLGRAITPDDDRATGAGPIVVISHALWQRAFQGRPDVLGRTVRLRGGSMNGNTSGFEELPGGVKPDDAALTIVGVAPPEFFGVTVGKIVDAWIPLTMQPIVTPGRAWLTRRSASWVGMIGRRREGVTDTQASAALTALWREIRSDEIGPAISDDQRTALASSVTEVETAANGFGGLRREVSQPLMILMTVVTLVLMIACLNVANLLLARATARRQEISMRLSLGAGRARLIRQLLTESLMLAGAGGVLGLAVAALGSRLLVNMVAGQSLRLVPDARVLGFNMGVAMLCGLVFGLIPALRGTRGDLNSVLKEQTRGGAGRQGRAAKVLVAVQIAVSVVLLVCCGLFLRTLYNLKSQDVGYNPRGLVVARVDPVGAGYVGDEIGRRMVELMHRLGSLPGVETSTFSENGLFSGTESGAGIEVPGFKPTSNDDLVVAFDQAGPGYFTNVGIPLVLGRDFTERDMPDAPRVTIVNDALARFYFGEENPLGRRIVLDDLQLEIVGVAHDAKDHELREVPKRRFYVSYLQPIDGITTANFEVRGAANAGALGTAIRAEIERFDPKLQVISLNTAQALIDRSIATEHLTAKLSTLFGVLAVLLAAIGLYGVMSYSVARRTSEIGVRMALGAPQRAVTKMILGEILVLVAIGAVAGALAAIPAARFLESLLYGLDAQDPLTLVACVVCLLFVGLVAGYLPARRAARISPIVALRQE